MTTSSSERHGTRPYTSRHVYWKAWRRCTFRRSNYVLLKEVLDNSIDEFKMQAGKKIEIIVEENLRQCTRLRTRHPTGKLVEAVSVLNTGGKYDSKAFKKSVGLNGVGVKAVNALLSSVSKYVAIATVKSALPPFLKAICLQTKHWIRKKAEHIFSSNRMLPCS